MCSSDLIGAELSTLATQELSPYRRDNEARVRIDGPQVLLEPNTAQMVAVILHELATNAVKYGALAAAGGRIEVNWSHSGDGWLALCWIERGGPPVESPRAPGLRPPRHRTHDRPTERQIQL